MLLQLENYNWEEVFGEGTGENCSSIIPDGPPGCNVSLDTFTREDVKTILGQEDGYYDGPDWIVWGRLRDGRYFLARGGCSYTGWDCCASNSGNVAKTKNQLIRYGMNEGERFRFKVSLPEDPR